jgi:predicted nucleic acid-binding protein
VTCGNLALQTEDADEVPAVTRDPDDDYLVALAYESEADVLVSGDRDLLETQGLDVEVISPREFVERLARGG